jgi:hypothetical protein
MSEALAAASVLLFALTFRWVGVVPVATHAMGRTRRTVAVLAASGLSEEEKERAARAAAMALFRSLWAITGLSLLAFVSAAVPIFAGIWLGLADEASIMAALQSPWLVGAGCAAFAAAYLIRR